MKQNIKIFLLSTASLILVLATIFLTNNSFAAKTKCPLKINSAYKYTGNSTIFYITKNCTKQAFLSPTAFFSYFKSWSQVNKTTKKTLDKIPKDKNYILSAKNVANQPAAIGCAYNNPKCTDNYDCLNNQCIRHTTSTSNISPPTTNNNAPYQTNQVVSDALKLIQKGQAEIRSLNTNTYKMDIAANYDTYTMPDANFRIVCQQPCPIAEKVLRLKTVGAYLAINKLTSITKVGPGPNTMPVDIHLTGDAECGSYDSNARKDSGFAGWSASRWNGGYGAGTGAWNCSGACTGSYACLFEYEKSSAHELTYPLDEFNAPKVESQQLLTHEYAHTLFYDRIYKSPEDFVIALSYFVAGNQGVPVVSGCDATLSAAAPGTYNMCKKCSLDFSDYGDIFTAADQLYKAHMATDKYKQNPLGGWVTVPELKQIINNVILKKTGQNKDAVADCGYDTWLNLTGSDGGVN